jgi:DNA-binding NarL/FixJ family response regulator
MEESKPTVKIGLVDDHQLILDGMEKLLKTVDDYEIVFIENKAANALKYIEKKPVNLVITDVAMPDMNGAEFVKRIRQDHPKIKILVMSMYKTDLINEDDIEGYILKESSSAAILKKVREIVENPPKNHTLKSEKKYTGLSPREKEIVIEIGKGLSSEQIAEKLFLSYYTVESHKKNIFLKLNVKTTNELIRKAMHLGIIY